MILLDALELLDLNWLDPFASEALEVRSRRRLSGALTIFPRVLTGGRPITLEAPADQPLTLAQARTLAEWAAQPDASHLLDMPLHGVSFTVRWHWEAGNPVEVRPLLDYADPADSDPCVGILRLITL